MNGLKVFIVHGRDSKTLRQLLTWFKRRKILVEPITFSQLAIPGETIPTELERIASMGDAAIVLATPDDVGGLSSSSHQSARARQNVWVELGWFWARLGRKRTLLLLKGRQEIPSDISGVLYIPFEDDIKEVSERLRRFIDGLEEAEPDEVTELVSAGADTGSRSAQYQMVFGSAYQSVIITGIGMTNVRHDLPAIFGDILENKKDMLLDFVVIDKEFVRRNEDSANTAYRPGLADEIDMFERGLSDQIKKWPDKQKRIHLFRYPGIMTFSATIADPGAFGSLMAVETILPTDSSHFMARPRMLLRRRSIGGLYDRFINAIYFLRQHSIKITL